MHRKYVKQLKRIAIALEAITNELRIANQIENGKLAKEGSSYFQRCYIAPEGWRCTRNAGHTGPCAAVKEESCCGCSFLGCLHCPIHWLRRISNVANKA